MSKQYPGGFITKNFTAPTTSSAPGMWTLDQALYYTQQGTWPIPTQIDPYFNYVSMLLHGNGSASGTTNVLPFNSDASTNNFNLAINGDARSNNFTPYQGNGYYSNLFNGSTDYLTVPLAAYDFGTGAFTCEAWVYIRSVATTNMIFYGSVSGGALDELAVAVNTSQQLGWETNNSISNSGGFIPLNTWTHIALVRNGSTVTGYVNGSSVGTTTDSGAVTPTTHSLIGSYRGTILFTNGYISNARVTKSAVYTSNFTPSTTPLAAITNTSLLTCQSNRFIDNSTNAYTITPSGTAAVSPAQPFTLSSSVATYGSGYFDGTGDNLTTASNTAFAFGTGDFTIEFWAYKTANTPGSYDIAFGTGDAGTGNNGYFIELSSTRGFVFASNNSVVLSYAMNPNTSAWAHYAVTRSGSTLRLFVNGAVVTSTTYSTSLTSTVAVRVGGTGNDFFGYLADMRVVKGTAVYTTTYTLPTAPLTAISGTSLLTTQYNGAGNNNGFKDNSQNNFVVTRNGNTTQGTFTPYGANWSNYFNGSSGVTVSSTSSQFGFSGDFTWEAWVNLSSLPSSGGNYSIICSRGTVASNSAFQFLIGNSSGTYQITGTISISSSDSNLIWNIPTAPSVGTWYHVAIVRSGSSVQAYWNGTAIGSAQTASGTTNTPTVNPSIGFRGGSYNDLFFNGYISNLRMVGSAVYTSNFTPSTTPLTAISGTRILTCADNRFIDDSTNAFTLAVYSAPSVQRFSSFSPTSAYSTSVIGGSGYFDGSGDYLSFPSSSGFAFGTGDFTVEGWVYMTAVQSVADGIFQQGTSAPPLATTTNTVAFGTVSSGQVWQIYANGTNTNSSATWVLNTWYHFAVVRSSGTTKLYINGVSVISIADTTNYTGTYFEIGAIYNTTYTHIGYISDVRVVKGTAVYTTTFTPPTAPLTAITNTQLLTSFTNAAIYDNAMMNDLETVGNAMVSTSVKKYGAGSLAFDGTGDWLSVPDSQNFNFGSGNFTIEFWIYLNSVSGTIGILGKRTNEANYAPFIMIVTSSALKVYMSINGSLWAVNGLSTSTLSTSTWYNIAVTRSGSTVYMFLNGTSVGSTGTLSGALMTNTSPLYIGADSGSPSGSSTLNGYIDDLRVTKGVARYTANFTPPTSQLPDQ